MNSKQRFLTLSAALAMALAACAAPPRAAPKAAAPAEAATAMPAKPAAPTVLKIRMPVDLTTADPAFHPAGMDTVTAETVGEGLVHFKPGTWELENVLAESIKTSDDGLRIEFKLKEGVKFHGEYGEMTADDVKFSYERFIDPKLNAPYKGDWEALDKVDVTGKYTGVIILKKPFAPLWASTLPVTAGVIVSKKAVEKLGDKYGINPIGTGPYMFASWIPKQKVVLKRNDNYWGAKPEWDEIQLIPITDDSAAEIALESGEIDFTLIGKSAIDRIGANNKFEVIKRPTINYSGIFLNTQHPKMKDIKVRQAIRLAVDVPSIIAGVYDGKVERMCAVAAIGQLGYWKDAPCYQRDIAKAKALLKEAGAEKLDLQLTMEQGEEQKALGEVIQANLKEIGINVEINQVDGGGYYGDDKTLRERQMIYFDWGTTNPDPYWQIVWFSCAQIGQYNWMYWCDKDFDKVNSDATLTNDVKQRDALYIQSQKLWDANANVVWTVRPTNYYAVRAGLAPSQNPNGLVIPASFKSK